MKKAFKSNVKNGNIYINKLPWEHASSCNWSWKNAIRRIFPIYTKFIGGIEIEDIEKSLKKTIKLRDENIQSKDLKELGLFRYRKFGEAHGYSPPVFKKFNLGKNDKKLKSSIKDDKPIYIRDLLSYKIKTPILNIDSLEECSSILKRFGSGGISFGAISENLTEN